MTPQELAALFGAIAALTPEAAKLVLALVTLFHKHGATAPTPAKTAVVQTFVPAASTEYVDDPLAGQNYT